MQSEDGEDSNLYGRIALISIYPQAPPFLGNSIISRMACVLLEQHLQCVRLSDVFILQVWTFLELFKRTRIHFTINSLLRTLRMF